MAFALALFAEPSQSATRFRADFASDSFGASTTRPARVQSGLPALVEAAAGFALAFFACADLDDFLADFGALDRGPALALPGFPPDRFARFIPQDVSGLRAARQ